VTQSVGAVAKRSLAMPPKCMTNGVTYPASRITSACSCIDVPASTVSATQIVSTETVTEVRYIPKYLRRCILTVAKDQYCVYNTLSSN
jgi:hypothetical protein